MCTAATRQPSVRTAVTVHRNRPETSRSPKLVCCASTPTTTATSGPCACTCGSSTTKARLRRPPANRPSHCSGEHEARRADADELGREQRVDPGGVVGLLGRGPALHEVQYVVHLSSSF